MYSISASVGFDGLSGNVPCSISAKQQGVKGSNGPEQGACDTGQGTGLTLHKVHADQNEIEVEHPVDPGQ